MARKKKDEPTLVPGVKAVMKYLPRDIKMGWTEDTPKGRLFMGWDNTTDSLQLWEVVSEGAEGEGKFLGYICRKWDGGPGL